MSEPALAPKRISHTLSARMDLIAVLVASSLVVFGCVHGVEDFDAECVREAASGALGLHKGGAKVRDCALGGCIVLYSQRQLRFGSAKVVDGGGQILSGEVHKHTGSQA